MYIFRLILQRVLGRPCGDSRSKILFQLKFCGPCACPESPCMTVLLFIWKDARKVPVGVGRLWHLRVRSFFHLEFRARRPSVTTPDLRPSSGQIGPFLGQIVTFLSFADEFGESGSSMKTADSRAFVQKDSEGRETHDNF